MFKTKRHVKYCPDCRKMLVSLTIFSSLNFPNEYRSWFYFCPQCSKDETTKLIMVANLDLKIDENRGKFPAIADFSDKLRKTLNQILSDKNFVPVNFSLKKPCYCINCKKRLRFDRFGSKYHMDNNFDIKSYFHFNCGLDGSDDSVLTFVRGKVSKIELIRIYRG